MAFGAGVKRFSLLVGLILIEVRIIPEQSAIASQRFGILTAHLPELLEHFGKLGRRRATLRARVKVAVIFVRV